MNGPELHADDLLDKEARGELTSAERVRLEQHVQACSVCRFERQVRDDFRLEFEALGQAARKKKIVPRRRTLPRARWILLAVAATLVTGAAAAEWEAIKRTVFSSFVMEQSRAPSVPPATTRVAAKKDPAGKRADDQLALEPAPVVETSPSDSIVEPPPVVALVPPAKAEPAHPTPQRQAAALLAVPAKVDEEAPEVEAPAPAPATADSLFAAANDARQHGAYGEAVRLYGDLVQQFPLSAEATASHAIVGRLLLDRGDPSGALAEFDAYLRSGMTTLSEEARVGRALALERLGRSSEEADAWTTLLESFPQSVHASRAKSRLAKLGNR